MKHSKRRSKKGPVKPAIGHNGNIRKTGNPATSSARQTALLIPLTKAVNPANGRGSSALKSNTGVTGIVRVGIGFTRVDTDPNKGSLSPLPP